jgi:hypothetical protein
MLVMLLYFKMFGGGGGCTLNVNFFVFLLLINSISQLKAYF